MTFSDNNLKRLKELSRFNDIELRVQTITGIEGFDGKALLSRLEAAEAILEVGDKYLALSQVNILRHLWFKWRKAEGK